MQRLPCVGGSTGLEPTQMLEQRGQGSTGIGVPGQQGLIGHVCLLAKSCEVVEKSGVVLEGVCAGRVTLLT